MAPIESIRDLELFRLVCELGSFTDAAAVAHVSQPTVSQAVKRMEMRIGSPLIRRSRFGADGDLVITAAGRVLVQRSKAIFDQIDGLSDDLKHLNSPSRYRVGLPPILSKYLFGNDSFATLGDAVGGNVAISTVGSQAMLQKIKQHTVDFGIIAVSGDAPDIPGIDMVKVASSSFGLVTSRNRKGTTPRVDIGTLQRDDDDLNFVTLNHEYVHAQASDQLLNELDIPMPTIEVSDVNMMKSIIASDQAIGLMASIAIEDEPEFRFVSLDGAQLPSFDIYSFMNHATRHEQGAEAFSSLVNRRFDKEKNGKN
ncbi:LysR family transcriptional regulator [Bifidobacterium sp. ESL0732]|uniref:LysR family transcriptional regulator n=1 Tax=Bifidobacterium sp. ESL0732 TaxID=2983222 RepID=UPI0023F8785A|nr:LysR family transcriptional regulator [Bifidobacterium sp. ESL0732]WEV64764.1 LysR family transcriptional regulator [Bifidobacterium sp. ESL0732]